MTDITPPKVTGTATVNRRNEVTWLGALPAKPIDIEVDLALLDEAEIEDWLRTLRRIERQYESGAYLIDSHKLWLYQEYLNELLHPRPMDPETAQIRLDAALYATRRQLIGALDYAVCTSAQLRSRYPELVAEYELQLAQLVMNVVRSFDGVAGP